MKLRSQARDASFSIAQSLFESRRLLLQLLNPRHKLVDLFFFPLDLFLLPLHFLFVLARPHTNCRFRLSVVLVRSAALLCQAELESFELLEGSRSLPVCLLGLVTSGFNQLLGIFLKALDLLCLELLELPSLRLSLLLHLLHRFALCLLELLVPFLKQSQLSLQPLALLAHALHLLLQVELLLQQCLLLLRHLLELSQQVLAPPVSLLHQRLFLRHRKLQLTKFAPHRLDFALSAC
mmetsp:Transcript_21697/g.71775  ORF Transcript_21697/g.71775 Transcript_21697/m.71775 type:complete len:236 (-) Transcript_21697:1277-1984(-)